MLHVDRRITEGVWRSEVGVAVHVEAFAMPVIRPGLGHGVHKAGVGASDFCIQTAAYYLKLPHCGQWEEKYRIIAAALVALQWIVEVGAIERNVRIDRPLARDHQAIAV